LITSFLNVAKEGLALVALSLEKLLWAANLGRTDSSMLETFLLKQQLVHKVTGLVSLRFLLSPTT
jgi:hypothetical protein